MEIDRLRERESDVHKYYVPQNFDNNFMFQTSFQSVQTLQVTLKDDYELHFDCPPFAQLYDFEMKNRILWLLAITPGEVTQIEQ